MMTKKTNNTLAGKFLIDFILKIGRTAKKNWNIGKRNRDRLETEQ